MKTVILAGGRGARMGPTTRKIPKPMIRIGSKPMLWHVMNCYARQGHTDFIIAGGYKIDVIDAWLNKADLPWDVDLVDTGEATMTGGRIKALGRRLRMQFFLTYGDGVCDVDLSALLSFHDSHMSFCTVTAVHPPPRFGELELDKSYVTKWQEKKNGKGWISGGFYVCEAEALEYIGEEDEPWETGACTRMVEAQVMTAFRHEGFWQCMDTLHDVSTLRDWWKDGAPWIG